MHANALKRKHKAHAHACVLCRLTSCQRGREFCTRLNGRNTLRLECVEVCFPPPQQQSAGEDKLTYTQHPSAVSPIFLSPLQFPPPQPASSSLQAPWLRVLAAHACVSTHGRNPEHSDPPCFPSYVTVDKSGGRRR